MGWRQIGFAMFAAALALAGGPAAAEDTLIASESQYVVNLGIGGMAKPQYPGADRSMFVPYPIIEFERLYLPFFGQRERTTEGVYFYPSFGVIGERKPSDDKSLVGTKKIDWAFEAGMGAGFRYDWLQAFATIRQGFNGYSGQTGELGLDVLVPVTNRVDVAFGPRASWGSTDYMETYFGVTQAESAKGILSPYKPDAGFKSAGLAAEVNWWLTDRTRLQVKGSWDRLIGDAADSPIVRHGSRDQWTVGIGISHKFEFDLFR